MFIIESHLGSTDCSDCQIFRRDKKIFAKQLHQTDVIAFNITVSLPIKIAELSSTELAKIALARISEAIETGDTVVKLKDL